jgi:hypothetical protein
VPDVAVRVAVDDPAEVPAGAVRESVAAVPGVSVMGDGWAVTPAGKPEIATETVAENPLSGVARTDTVPGVPLAVKLTAAGMVLSEKSGVGVVVPACMMSDPCVLAVCPFRVVINVTVAVAGIAEDAAVSVKGNDTPGVSDNVAGEIVTPVGRPDTVIAAAPAPVGATSSREACCPVVPAVRLILDGVSVSSS